MAKKKKKTSDAIEILHRHYLDGNPEMLKLLEEERLNASVAEEVYRLRTDASLTQRELAKIVGTQASVICRLEDANYGGRTLSMLHRIAIALNNRVVVSFMPIVSTGIVRQRPKSRGN